MWEKLKHYAKLAFYKICKVIGGVILFVGIMCSGVVFDGSWTLLASMLCPALGVELSEIIGGICGLGLGVGLLRITTNLAITLREWSEERYINEQYIEAHRNSQSTAPVAPLSIAAPEYRFDDNNELLLDALEQQDTSSNKTFLQNTDNLISNEELTAAENKAKQEDNKSMLKKIGKYNNLLKIKEQFNNGQDIVSLEKITQPVVLATKNTGAHYFVYDKNTLKQIINTDPRIPENREKITSHHFVAANTLAQLFEKLTTAIKTFLGYTTLPASVIPISLFRNSNKRIEEEQKVCPTNIVHGLK